MRLLCAILLAGCAALAAPDDAHALLNKAKAAYLENRERERYWNWTTTSKRTIIDKRGEVVQEIPSVTIESPIRSDGKRCNAVLAWGDGLQPYLADASADQRCTVEEENVEPFKMETLLEATRVRIASRGRDAIVLALSPDKSLEDSKDRFQRCIGSLEGTIQLDRATFFPRRIALKVADSGCEQQTLAVDHYEALPLRPAVSTLRKGAVMERIFELQKDKTGDASKNYWAQVHAHSVRPLRKGAVNLIMWGRRIPLIGPSEDRHIVLDTDTAVTEFSAESVLRVEGEVKKEK